MEEKKTWTSWLLEWSVPQKPLYLWSVLLAVGNVVLKIIPYFLIADVVRMFLGGEKQRISIARAIMKDAPVIILDEATANVDPENEKDLMDAVEALTKEKTVIMIAHRLKTVRHADQIVVVDRGHIVQLGIHEQLMAQEVIEVMEDAKRLSRDSEAKRYASFSDAWKDLDE